jgi:hypothetical protein
MKNYVKTFEQFMATKINEATDNFDVNLVTIELDLSKTPDFSKGAVADVIFKYQGKPINQTAVPFQFVREGDILKFTKPQFNLADAGKSLLSGENFILELDANKAATDKKMTVSRFTVQGAMDIDVKKYGGAWMAVNLNPGFVSIKPVDIEPYEKSVGDTFVPNEDTIDDAKKVELNKELDDFGVYYSAHEAALQAPGATDKYTMEILGSASQVTTTYAGGNQKLAENRAINLKKYMIDYFKTSLPKLSKLIGFVAETKGVVGPTPYVKGTDKPDDPKFLAEQFVKLQIIVKPV